MARDDWPAFLPPEALLRQPGEQRREAGREHFSAVMAQLLAAISHPQLSELADWACAEPGTLHTSQISLLRNGRTRMLGMKCADALGRINQAAWVLQQRPELLNRLGTAPLTPRLEGVLRHYRPLLHPLSGQPLGAGEFLALYLGTLQLPLAAATEQPPRAGLAERLGPWLDQALQQRGLSLRQAAERLRRAWPQEPSGPDQLLRLVAGFEEVDRDWFEQRWPQIRALLAEVLEREIPQDLP